jgi:23S rRNA U2552 (ribose-2'-O)-methylase RlmE/FtsJ
MSDPFIKIKNIQAAQTPQTLNIFCKIIKDFDLIIEIGTNRGGFTIWLNENKKHNCMLLSYEINPSCVEIPKTDKAYSCVRFENCFLTKCLNEIKTLIQNSGRTLFLCDGGNKVSEFKTFSPYLKPNDVIMLHDYADSPNEKQNWENIKNKYNLIGGFNEHESSYSSIEISVKENNLDKFMYDEFVDVLWGSFIKV